MGAHQATMRPVDLLVLECLEAERLAYARLVSVTTTVGASDPALERLMTASTARNKAPSSTVSG
jgi:hypothetical protein